MGWRYVTVRAYVDEGEYPGNALPQPPLYPGNALPGYQPGIDNSLPRPPLYPGNALPGYQPGIDNTLPGQQPGIDNSLPGSQPGIDNTLPRPGGRPDNSLPGNQPGIDNSLPGSQPGIDNTLPPFAQPKAYDVPDEPTEPPDDDGDWAVAIFNDSATWVWVPRDSHEGEAGGPPEVDNTLPT